MGYSWDIRDLAIDSVFQKVAGLFDFPVQSTISRFLSGLKVKVAHRLALVNFDLLMEFRGGFKGFKEITLKRGYTVLDWIRWYPTTMGATMASDAGL